MNNVLKVKLESLNGEKAKYFRNLIIDLSKNYDITPFNLTFDVGERTEIFISNEFNNLMFSHIYEYIELYENNRKIFIESILEKINIEREKIIFKYKEITSNFYDDVKLHSTEYINKDYLKAYEKNYKLCLNYSIDELNETLKKDEEHYTRYIIYQNRLEICEKIREKNYNIIDIDIVKLNINDSNIIKLLEKIKEEKENKTNEYNNTEEIKNNISKLNEYLNNLCEETFRNKYNFINETKILLDCEDNSYYLNYFNLTYFDNFDIEILNILENITAENKEAIFSYYVGGQFIENFLFLNDYIKLENYTDFSIEQFKYNLGNFQDMSEYINYKMGKKYNDFLKEKLYEAFNLSFTEFMEKSISGEIEDNLLIYVLGKIDLNVNSIEEKVKNEKGYYSLLLNKTKELGITSKNTFIYLYDYLSDRVNKTLHYQIEDYISDNIIFFFRENKYIFKDIFLN